MKYEIGTVVLYGSHGVCRIDEIIERDFSGALTLYYVLKPAYDDKSVMYVPVHNEVATSRLRRILSVEEVNELIRTMPDENTIWIADDNARRDRYKSIISSGDRKGLVKLIKTLYLRQQEQIELGKGKKLHVADERFMKDAEKALYEEFSYVLNITLEQVVPFITEQIFLDEK